jgi:hypothetical protein
MAKIRGSDVRRCSSTTTPFATSSPAASASVVSGDHDQVGGQPSAVGQLDLAHPRVTVQRRNSLAEQHRVPGFAVQRGEVGGDLRRRDAVEEPVLRLDDRHRAAGVRSELQSDEATAGHDDVLGAFEGSTQPVGVVAGAQGKHARQVRAGHGQRPVARAGGQDQVVVRQSGAVFEAYFRRGPVDRSDPAGDQLDVLLGEEVRTAQVQLFEPGGPGQVGLRQRRPLVRHARLVPDQHDPAGEAAVPQRRHGLEPALPGPDDENGAHSLLTHGFI